MMITLWRWSGSGCYKLMENLSDPVLYCLMNDIDNGSELSSVPSNITVITIPGSDDCTTIWAHFVICVSTTMSKSKFWRLHVGLSIKTWLFLWSNVSAYQAGQHLHFYLYRASIINSASPKKMSGTLCLFANTTKEGQPDVATSQK